VVGYDRSGSSAGLHDADLDAADLSVEARLPDSSRPCRPGPGQKQTTATGRFKAGYFFSRRTEYRASQLFRAVDLHHALGHDPGEHHEGLLNLGCKLFCKACATQTLLVAQLAVDERRHRRVSAELLAERRDPVSGAQPREFC